MSLAPALDERLRDAVKYFWKARNLQARKQGSKTGTRTLVQGLLSRAVLK
jgi:hypothetical protein